jgi:PII-like signaling protein
MRTAVAIAVAGAVGALARYGFEGLVSRRLPTAFPWGTFAVNVSGSFALGFLFTAHGRPLYQAIVERVRKEGLAGATVLRGIEGFGADSRLHTSRILRLSEDLPVVIEIVDTAENIDRVVPLLDEMVQEGMLTVERVHVISYRGSARSSRLAVGSALRVADRGDDGPRLRSRVLVGVARPASARTRCGCRPDGEDSRAGWLRLGAEDQAAPPSLRTHDRGQRSHLVACFRRDRSRRSSQRRRVASVPGRYAAAAPVGTPPTTRRS